MGDLTASLGRSEYACRCNCGFDTVDYSLVVMHQDLVDHFGGFETVRIDITGPNRCREYNDSLRKEYELSGGKSGAQTAKGSMHIYGRAGDIKLYYRDTGQQISPTKVYKYLDEKYAGQYGFKLYHNRVHTDTRDTAWRSDELDR